MVAGPLFVFMAIMLQKAGIAEALYSAIHRWMGPVRGGLAIGTVIICTLFAAMSGISAVGTVTMGLIALPEMLNRNYSKSIALGCIAAGGALGQLIPPSILFIVYALFAPESVGALYMGGIIPGLILSALFILYIIVRCFFQPKLGPPLPLEERVSFKEKVISLKGVILPILTVIAVLGSMFTGFASVTEAAAVGAAGSVISAAIYGRLTWGVVRESLTQTVGLMGMVMWIIFGASAFTSLYGAIGATKMVQEIMMALPGGKWGVIIAINIILVIMGCFLDPYGILMITVPIFVPVIKAMGFSAVWFGVIFVMNMELGFLTPPFGYNLFYLKSVAPEGVTMADIYKSIWAFVVLQAIGLAIVMIFPDLTLWLPGQMKF
jgi:tripartite ATP-independent transporter DctM subunit